MKQVQSWGRVGSSHPASVLRLTWRHAALSSAQTAPKPWLAFGRGRSYGDVCLNAGGTLLQMAGLDRFIAFDNANGVLRCEAGVTLGEILALVVPQNLFLSVTPGTREATVGGAIANDVHGKNHHAKGTFGHHVLRFELVRSTGERLVCSVQDNCELFAATIGGLGLTGLITWAEIQLDPIANPYMEVETTRFADLDTFWNLNAQAQMNWPYTVAWIDCVAQGSIQGRGVLITGRHAAPQSKLPNWKERHRTVPLDPPLSLVNGLSLRVFNTLYWHMARSGRSLSHYVPYFYPLDALRHWNRIYGRAGFYQYQCVLPPENMRESIAALLQRIARSGQGSFLAVLKTFGTIASLGMMSFPRPGATLALDFANKGQATLRLFEELDSVVKDAGGAVYPAKDARMSPTMFRASFPLWERFANYIDPAFSSDFWRRVTA